MAKRRYQNSKITILWDSSKCVHAAYCIRELPQVFDVRKRPWVNINGASAEDIKKVIDKCPFGALSYEVPSNPQPKTPDSQITPQA